MKRLLAAALTASFVFAPVVLRAGTASTSTPVQRLTSKLRWRSIGPYIGGRVVAVAGVPSDPDLFYMGGVQGGIWRSTNYGSSWENISDGKLPRTADSIGALAVAPSNPKIIYAGTGEGDIRQDFDTGVGVFKTSDAGATWHYAGLRNTHVTTGIVVDPRNPNVVYVSTMGHVFAPNSARGVYKTTDGGKTWKRVLFVNDSTGAAGIVMDPHHPRVLYAAMWQAKRTPWKLTSGGPGSGLYKTVDGGAHWTNLSKNAGFPKGILGKIGVSVAPSDPRIVYAIVQAREGGVYRSDDAGATWKYVNGEMKLRQRAFYYTAIFADPKNPMIAYAPEVDAIFKTTDGGKTWKPAIAVFGDHHVIWINPHDTKILLEGDDGGAAVSTDGGKTWSSENDQPTGQFYHVALDNRFPFHVYGAQQDEGAWEGPSSTILGYIPVGDWKPVADGESTFVAIDPDDPHVTYGSGYYTSFFRFDNHTGENHNVSPWPRYISGSDAAENKYRFGWTHPILFSPANSHELLLASQVVFSSTDRGETWKILSPDLTRDDKSTEGPSGGPISLDQTGAEFFPDVSALAVSPKNGGVIWAGSADGLVHVTRDHGAHWALVTPPSLPEWTEITSIEPSDIHEGAAYLSASRYQWDDFHPYVYETTDYGAHWTKITAGLPDDQYVFAVRQDPREPKLLFAGTRSTVYVSLDGGAQWQALTLNLPGVQVRDLAIDTRQGEVVAATHGRSFWILGNLALLEGLAREGSLETSQAHVFEPETAWLSHAYGNVGGAHNAGDNPPFGATIFFNLPSSYDGKTPLTLSFLSGDGSVVQRYTLHRKPAHETKPTEEQRENFDAIQARAYKLAKLTAVKPGLNAFQWDLRYPPAVDVPGWRSAPTDDWPDTGDGPTILPGTYSVVLRYGTAETKQTLRVRLDPRLHPAPGDLEARLALEERIHDTIDALDTALTNAMDARSHVPPGRRAALDAQIAKLIQMDIHSSEADSMVTTRLRAQLGFLANSLEGSYQRPTAAEYATFEELQKEASAGIAALKSFSPER
jgi:photosystem II stability/assembly factor-like uncharacterized protein